MNKSFRWIICYSVLFSFLAVLYWRAGSTSLLIENNEGSKMSTEKKMTVCLGRFKIDFPEGMVYSLGAASIYGWQITSDVGESVEEFANRLAIRESELMKLKNVRNLPSLEIVKDVKNKIANGKVFLFDRVWGSYLENGKSVDFQGAKIEALVYIGKASFRLTTGSGELEDVQQAIRLINQIRFREPDEVPEQPGFCIAYGLILDPIPMAEPVESAVLFAGYADRPDLAIAFNSMSNIGQQTKLIERHENSSIRTQYPANFRDIFVGKRTINGIPGEEFLKG